MEEILLVDKKDNPQGYLEKITAHENGGTLHRAFSIFVYNENFEMLLQKRAEQKYHFPGLWTNTCCGHQIKTDRLISCAANRRLKEEFGFQTELQNIFNFVYQAESSNNLSEHEYDHVFVGIFSGEPLPNPDEISEFRWMHLDELQKDINENPDNYTPWFKIALEKQDKLLLNEKRLKESMFL